MNRLLLLVGAWAASASAFSFNTSTPTQCGEWTVQWSGGTGPFGIVLVPTITVDSGRIVNITVPSSVTNSSYTFTLNEPSGLEFLTTMYDADGWGTGGTTSVLTVGSSDDTSCLSDNLLYDFYFSVSPDSNPSQCGSTTVSWNSNASLPVHLYGLIPAGSAFSLPVPESTLQNSYDWTVDIAAGTQYLLLMSDAGQYQTGGSTSLYTVQSGSTSCMNSSSPSSGASTPSSTSSSGVAQSSVGGVGGSSSGGKSDSNSGSGSGSGSSSSSHTGAIVGGTLGGVAFLLFLALLALCCIRRKARRRADDSADPAVKSYGVSSGEKFRPTDLLAGRRHRSDDTDEGLTGGQGNIDVRGDAYQPSPFRYPSPPPVGTSPNRLDLISSAEQGQGRGQGLPPSAFTYGGAAAAGEKQLRSPNSPTTFSSPFASIDHQRPSDETDRTLNSTSGGTGQAGTGVTGHDPSELGVDSNAATLGHGRSSIEKRQSGQFAPPLPTQTQTPTGDGRPLPETPRQERQTTFVQHEDSGEVVDLPPRYDQLRTRNPEDA